MHQQLSYQRGNFFTLPINSNFYILFIKRKHLKGPDFFQNTSNFLLKLSTRCHHSSKKASQNECGRPLMHDARIFNLRACATCTTNVDLADYNTLHWYRFNNTFLHFCYVPYFWPFSTHPYIVFLCACVWVGGWAGELLVCERIGTRTNKPTNPVADPGFSLGGGGGRQLPKWVC